MAAEREFEFIADNVLALFDKTFPLYLVLGDHNFLIDSGPAVRAPGFLKRIRQMLSEITDLHEIRIDTLLLTHSHWDHTGGSSYFQEKLGFKVLASRRTVELVQKPKVISLIDQMNQGYKCLIKSLEENRFQGLKNLEIIGEGQIIPVDQNRYFQVIFTPGHTQCSVSFLLLPQKILFPGDAAGLMEPDCTIRPLFFSNYSEYEQSLEKLIGLEANAIAFPHNKRIIGKKQVKDYLDDSLYRTIQAKTEIENLLGKGMETIDVARAIYDHEFSNLSFMGPPDILIANLESMVKSVQHEKV